MPDTAFPYKYNIVVDNEDGVCNLYYGCLTPYFNTDKLIFYTKEADKNKFTQHVIDMSKAIAFSLTKIE